MADAAQAVGASYAGRPVAAWADATTLSFYPTKNLGACGDGGMVLTTRSDVAERVRLLRDHGSTRKYTHVELGGCSRLDELQAALLRVKLKRLPEWNERRRAIARHYDAALAGCRSSCRLSGRRATRLPPVHGASAKRRRSRRP